MTNSKEPASHGSVPDAVPSFADEVQRFHAHVEAMESSIFLTMFLLTAGLNAESQRVDTLLKKHGTLVGEDDNGSSRYQVAGLAAPLIKRQTRRLQHLEIGCRILPESMIVSLVSQFDVLVGRILRTIYLKQPALLSASQRTLTFEQLSSLGSIAAAKEFLLEKEVESLLRESHIAQFEWMEKKFDVPLRKGLALWPKFVELTERRNLFVHTEGVVSTQYLNMCKQQKASVADVRLGEQLGVSPEYVKSAHACVLEIGIKLTHVLWRKLFPNEREDADRSLVSAMYELLITEKYEIAQNLGAFAREVIRRFSHEECRRTIYINECLAHCLAGDSEHANELINKEDWSACSGKFRLALAVLSGDVSAAADWMRRIGDSGEVGELEYHEWPLFAKLRAAPEFSAAYRDVFGHEYIEGARKPSAAASSASRETAHVHRVESMRKLFDLLDGWDQTRGAENDDAATESGGIASERGASDGPIATGREEEIPSGVGPEPT